MLVAVDFYGKYIAVRVANDMRETVLRMFPWPATFAGRTTCLVEAREYAKRVAFVLRADVEIDSGIEIGVEAARLGLCTPNHAARRKDSP